jgi:hypothetical protein
MTTATPTFTRRSITGSRAARVGNAVIADYVRTLAADFEPLATNSSIEPQDAELAELLGAAMAETPQRAQSTLRGGYLSRERRRPCSFPSRVAAELS